MMQLLCASNWAIPQLWSTSLMPGLGLERGQYGWTMFAAMVLRVTLPTAHIIHGVSTTVGTMKMLVSAVLMVSTNWK